jgi:hypothetical protein
MANEEQLARLKQGVADWNAWRRENASIQIDLSSAYLSEADLSGALLMEANLMGAYLTGANLNGANLTGAYLNGAHLIGAHLMEADLKGALLSGADLTDAQLNGANLTDAQFIGAQLARADLTGAHLMGAHLSEARFIWANLSGANLSGAYLTRAQLVATNLTGANLTGCRIYGVSAWNLNLEGATQTNLVITPTEEPVITVDDLEVAQFIYLLLNYKKFRNVINSVTERGVLILGRFGEGGLDVLHSVATKLREEKYLPIIFEFDRPTDRNLTETVKTLAGLARFVIVDLSGPSVPQELQATVPDFKIPFVPILEAGRKPYAMSLDILENDWVVKPIVSFNSIEDLMEKMPGSIIAPAEEKLKKRQGQLDQLFRS